jgi:transposase
MSERQKAKSYTAEFKESAVKLAVESGRPLAQTARELEVNKGTLYGWVRQYHQKQPLGQETVNSEHLYEELKRLRREVSIL